MAKSREREKHAVSRNLLVVEDNPINAMLARTLLQKLGHKVTVCETGEDGVASALRARGAFAGTSLSYNLKKLQDGGYLTQSRSKADKRTVHLTLTERGLKVRDRVAGLFDKQAVALEPTASVRHDDLAQLNRTVSRLERFWSDQIRYRL